MKIQRCSAGNMRERCPTATFERKDGTSTFFLEALSYFRKYKNFLISAIYNVMICRVHGRNLVGDVSPSLFHTGAYNMPCPPHFFLFRFCLWRGFTNKSDVCHAFCEELFISDGRLHIAKFMLKQSFMWYH